MYRCYFTYVKGHSSEVLGCPCGSGRQARVRAQVDKRPTLVALPVVITVRTDDDVGVAVAVDVCRRRHTSAEPGARLIALGGPGGSGRQARGRAQVHKRPTLVVLPVVISDCTDDDVGVAVA